MDTRAVVQKFKELGVEISKDDVWKVQSATCVKHASLERLAAKLGIEFDPPQPVVVSDTQVVLLISGSFRDEKNIVRKAWSYGEVNMGGSNPNYRVSGKASAYPFAMAEKRGKDRVIIKLAGLHGIHSEEELRGQDPDRDDRDDQEARENLDQGTSQGGDQQSAGQGDQGNVVPMRSRAKPEPQEQKPETVSGDIDAEMGQVDALKKRLDALPTAAEIKTFMQGDAKADLARLSEAAADEVVAYGRKLHKSLSAKEKAKETA